MADWVARRLAYVQLIAGALRRRDGPHPPIADPRPRPASDQEGCNALVYCAMVHAHGPAGVVHSLRVRATILHEGGAVAGADARARSVLVSKRQRLQEHLGIGITWDSNQLTIVAM